MAVYSPIPHEFRKDSSTTSSSSNLAKNRFDLLRFQYSLSGCAFFLGTVYLGVLTRVFQVRCIKKRRSNLSLFLWEKLVVYLRSVDGPRKGDGD